MAEKLLTAREVAARLNVSITWVLAHAGGRRSPQLPSIKMGKSVRFKADDIETFIERCNRRMAQGLPLQ